MEIFSGFKIYRKCSLKIKSNLKLNIVNIRRLLCEHQSYLVCFMGHPIFSLPQIVIFMFQGQQFICMSRKKLLLRVIMGCMGAYEKYCYSTEHSNVTSQPIVLKHDLRIKILNRKLLWELNILTQCNKFSSLISRLFYQYPAVMKE